MRPTLTHCQNGHEMVSPNLYLSHSSGRAKRLCRLCHIKRMRRLRLKKKLEKPKLKETSLGLEFLPVGVKLVG